MTCSAYRSFFSTMRITMISESVTIIQLALAVVLLFFSSIECVRLKTTTEFCMKHVLAEGYACEEHAVYTDDGFVLVLHRVGVKHPYSSKISNPRSESKGGPSTLKATIGSPRTDEFGFQEVSSDSNSKETIRSSAFNEFLFGSKPERYERGKPGQSFGFKPRPYNLAEPALDILRRTSPDISSSGDARNSAENLPLYLPPYKNVQPSPLSPRPLSESVSTIPTGSESSPFNEVQPPRAQNSPTQVPSPTTAGIPDPWTSVSQVAPPMSPQAPASLQPLTPTSVPSRILSSPTVSTFPSPAISPSSSVAQSPSSFFPNIITPVAGSPSIVESLEVPSPPIFSAESPNLPTSIFPPSFPISSPPAPSQFPSSDSPNPAYFMPIAPASIQNPSLDNPYFPMPSSPSVPRPTSAQFPSPVILPQSPPSPSATPPTFAQLQFPAVAPSPVFVIPGQIPSRDTPADSRDSQAPISSISPGSQESQSRRGGKGGPVLLMHHELLNGDSWFKHVDELVQSTLLPFILANDGFDVWIGHERATYWGHDHVEMDYSSQEYWNWTWDEHAKYDLPTMLRYIYSRTQSKVHLVGVSQSAAVGAAAATRPDVALLMRSLTLLGPTNIYRGTVSLPFLSELASIFGRVLDGPDFGPISGQFNSSREFDMQSGFSLGGPDDAITISGPDCCITSSITLFDNGWDGTTSFKNVEHFEQGIATNKFQHFDYGSPTRNLEAYGQPTPPSYILQHVPADLPMLVIYGGQDVFSPPDGILEFLSMLKKRPATVYLPFYGHFDLLFSSRREEDVYHPFRTFLQTGVGP